MPKITVTVSETTKRKLKRLAVAEDRTLSNYCDRALRQRADAKERRRTHTRGQ